MNKIILCAVAICTLFACQKQAPQQSNLRFFNYAMVGNSMYTKAVQPTDVTNAINSALPQQINLNLTAQSDNKIYQTLTGVGVNLPSDTYSVAGYSNTIPTSSEVIRGGSAYLSHTPYVNVEQQLVVTSDVAGYTLNGEYKSFVLVCDSSLVEKATVKTYKGVEPIDFIKSGESLITFVQGDYSNVHLEIVLTPRDKAKYKETTYTISTQKKHQIGYAQYGFWYIIEPTADGVQPKMIGLQLPDFKQGQLFI